MGGVGRRGEDGGEGRRRVVASVGSSLDLARFSLSFLAFFCGLVFGSGVRILHYYVFHEILWILCVVSKEERRRARLVACCFSSCSCVLQSTPKAPACEDS